MSPLFVLRKMIFEILAIIEFLIKAVFIISKTYIFQTYFIALNWLKIYAFCVPIQLYPIELTAQ